MLARLVIGLAALSVIAYACGLVAVGSYFPHPGEAGVEHGHVVLLVIATLVVTLLYVGACVLAQRSPPRLLFVIAVGLVARMVLLFGSPGAILEGDHERIRFDGRLVNRQLNPYEFKPAHLVAEDPDDILLSGTDYERLKLARARLTASDGAPLPEDVRRPDMRTTATPLALSAASLGDAFTPGSIRGYAFIILCGDFVAGFLLLLALRERKLPPGWLIIYAWCPILLKEAYCTVALDALLMPAIAGLVYCIVSKRRIVTAIPVAISIALRPAMLLLMPLLGRRLGALGLILTLVLAAMTYLPFHSSEVPAKNYVESQVHVWRHYEYNSFLENALRGAFRYVPARAENTLTIAGVTIVQPDEGLGALLAKVCCIVVLLGVVTYMVIRVSPDDGPLDVSLGDVFVLFTAMLLVSPVVKPQHALWLLPLMVLRPTGVAWLALPGILSISYLTHLAGPWAADLTFLGGFVSFRIFEYGAFLLLLGIDMVWRPVREVPTEVRRDEPAHSAAEEELGLDYTIYPEEDPAYV